MDRAGTEQVGAGWVSGAGTQVLCVRAFDLNSKGRCSEPHKGPIVHTLGIKQHMTPQHRAVMNWDAGANPGTTPPA